MGRSGRTRTAPPQGPQPILPVVGSSTSTPLAGRPSAVYLFRMERVFFTDSTKKGVKREFCFTHGHGNGLPMVVEHIQTPNGRFVAYYDFEEFMMISSGGAASAFLAVVRDAILPPELRDGPSIPGDREAKRAPVALRSFSDTHR